MPSKKTFALRYSSWSCAFDTVLTNGANPIADIFNYRGKELKTFHKIDKSYFNNKILSETYFSNKSHVGGRKQYRWLNLYAAEINKNISQFISLL